MNPSDLWTDQWTTKLVNFLFWIRLRAASRGCRNLLRTSAREGGAGKEPRIRTVRQLAAAAGDGLLGSVGSPGQLETSLNSGYLVGPCNSYLEGPTPISWAAARAPLLGHAARAIALGIRRRRRRSRRKNASACSSSVRRRAIFGDARSPRGWSRSYRARLPTLAVAVRDFANARSARCCCCSDRTPQ
jgi:hypothetical protein